MYSRTNPFKRILERGSCQLVFCQDLSRVWNFSISHFPCFSHSFTNVVILLFLFSFHTFQLWIINHFGRNCFVRDKEKQRSKEWDRKWKGAKMEVKVNWNEKTWMALKIRPFKKQIRMSLKREKTFKNCEWAAIINQMQIKTGERESEWESERQIKRNKSGRTKMRLERIY